MTDAAAHGHSHAHDHDHPHGSADGRANGHVHAGVAAGPEQRPAPAHGFSLIEASAGGRLVSILLVLAALWAGVYWALH